MTDTRIFNPDTIDAPRAPYSHVAQVGPGARLIVIAGQVAIDRHGNVVGDGDIGKQAEQIFLNLGEALKAANADWKNVIQFMTFLTRKEDNPAFAEIRKREFSRLYPDGAYPPNTLLVVSALANDAFLLEVQAIAAI